MHRGKLFGQIFQIQTLTNNSHYLYRLDSGLQVFIGNRAQGRSPSAPLSAVFSVETSIDQYLDKFEPQGPTQASPVIL